MLFLVLAGIWGVVATGIALMPNRIHWRAAYGLMAVGAPILLGVWWQNGALWAGVVLIAMMSVLRWPVWFAWRWIVRQVR
ncbi:MAG: DUF2484 family protein [Pseudomonadota bacterium]